MTIPDTRKKRVVVVGGGFAGLAVAGKLDRRLFQVVLIDRNNYHQFPPLLYQVASSGLASGSISFPYRKLMRGRRDLHFRLAEVTGVDTASRRIETSIGPLRYDYLVLAAGTTTNFFGNASIREAALPMKTLTEALELRNSLLLNLEKAINTTDDAERDALLNIVVVGGGATGVEVAGSLAEMKRFVVPNDYPELDSSRMRIILLEGGDRLLGAMSPQASAASERFLRDMGVEVMTSSRVTGYDGQRVALANGKSIATRTLIWVSGVVAETFTGLDPTLQGRGGRIAVDRHNAVAGAPGVYALGDICLLSEPDYPLGHPQVAPVAIQQGQLLARNLRALECGQPLREFRYRDKGALATVGRNKAVADIAGLHLSGFWAWAVWMLVHLRSILGVRNKLAVLVDWVWNYFTYDRSTRFILFIPRPKGHNS